MTATAPRTAARGPAAARIGVAAAFAVAFLWQEFGAVSDLLAWVRFAALTNGQLTSFAWLVLALGLLIPVVAFGAALVLGRRLRAGPLALVLVVALCASEAIGVSQLAFFLAGIRAI